MLTRPNYSVTNVQGLADLTKDQATLVKQTMDKTGSDTKDFLIALLDELESIKGAENIGIVETIAGSGTNVKARVEWLKTQIDAALLGQVPLGSLTDEYLSNEAGQLKSVVSEHLAENAKHVPHLGTTTNVGNAYSVTSAEVIDGNDKFSVKFNAVATGTATLNISSDGTPRTLKKPDGSDFKPKAGIYSFIRDDVNFQLLGEGGEYGTAGASQTLEGYTVGTKDGVIDGTLPSKIGSGTIIAPGMTEKAIPKGYFDGLLTSGKVSASLDPIVVSQQSGSFTWASGDTTVKTVNISAVDLTRSVILVDGECPTVDMKSVTTGRFTANNQIQFIRGYNSSSGGVITWRVVTFADVKSLQSGLAEFGGYSTYEQNITLSTVNISKCRLFYSMCVDSDTYNVNYSGSPLKLTSSTNLKISRASSINTYVKVAWFVVEFN